MTSTRVSEMTGQGFVHGVYSLVNPQIGTTRNGEPFLKCLLRDATGEAIGRMWRFDSAIMPDITSTGVSLQFVAGATLLQSLDQLQGNDIPLHANQWLQLQRWV